MSRVSSSVPSSQQLSAARELFGESDSDDDAVATSAPKPAAAQSASGQLGMAPAPTGVPSRQPVVDAAAAKAAEQRRAAAAPVYIPTRTATQRPLPQAKATLMPLPSTIALARQGFSATTFNGEAEAKQLRAQGKLLGADAAVIRWKWADDAKTKKATNTKMVKWSDGSTTMHIGTDVFQVSASQLLADCELLYAGTQAAQVRGQGKEETVLEAIAPVARRLQVRPLHGNTATKAVLLARQGTLRAGMRVMQTAYDAEALMAKRIKMTDDALAAQNKAAAREASLAARATQGGRVGDMSAAFLEEEEGLMFDDADEGVGLKQLKKSVRSGARDAELFAAESESEDDEEEVAAGDEVSDDPSEDEDDDEEEKTPAAAGTAPPASSAAAVGDSDSDSDDDDFDPSKPAGSGSDDDDDDDDDDLFDGDDEEGDAPAAAAQKAAAVVDSSDDDAAPSSAPVGGRKRPARAAVVDSSDEDDDEEEEAEETSAAKKPRPAGGTVLDAGDSDSD